MDWQIDREESLGWCAFLLLRSRDVCGHFNEFDRVVFRLRRKPPIEIEEGFFFIGECVGGLADPSNEPIEIRPIMLCDSY